MSNIARDPITTHVLDSTTGLPAKSIPVALTLLSYQEAFPNTKFTALTSTDGRISQWKPASRISLSETLQEIAQAFKYDETNPTHLSPQMMVWSLTFKTEAYWGIGRTFYPEVEVRFFVDTKDVLGGKGHWHVPVLLGPWSYTTYKGS